MAIAWSPFLSFRVLHGTHWIFRWLPRGCVIFSSKEGWNGSVVIYEMVAGWLRSTFLGLSEKLHGGFRSGFQDLLIAVARCVSRWVLIALWFSRWFYCGYMVVFRVVLLWLYGGFQGGYIVVV